jgi:hypothetical protein
MMVVYPDIDIIPKIKSGAFHDGRSVVAPSTLFLFLLRRCIRPAETTGTYNDFS